MKFENPDRFFLVIDFSFLTFKLFIKPIRDLDFSMVFGKELKKKY